MYTIFVCYFAVANVSMYCVGITTFANGIFLYNKGCGGVYIIIAVSCIFCDLVDWIRIFSCVFLSATYVMPVNSYFNMLVYIKIMFYVFILCIQI